MTKAAIEISTKLINDHSRYIAQIMKKPNAKLSKAQIARLVDARGRINDILGE